MCFHAMKSLWNNLSVLVRWQVFIAAHVWFAGALGFFIFIASGNAETEGALPSNAADVPMAPLEGVMWFWLILFWVTAASALTMLITGFFLGKSHGMLQEELGPADTAARLKAQEAEAVADMGAMERADVTKTGDKKGRARHHIRPLIASSTLLS